MSAVTDARCAAAEIRRAARHVSQAYDRFLAPSGLRVGQLSLLRALDRHGTSSVHVMAREMGMDRTTLGRNLRPLERAGLVTITVDAKDRRSRALRLSPAGAVKLAAAEPMWQAAQSQFEASVGPDQATEFMLMMKTVVAVSLSA